MRKFLVAAGFVGLLALFPPCQLASLDARRATPVIRWVEETICNFSQVEAYGPLDTGIVCGSGADAFDIFDQGVDSETQTFSFDEDDNLTKFTDHDVYSFGQWSNPATGAIVPYTQHNLGTVVFPVPGDFTSGTSTVAGENIYRVGAGQFVLQAVGRQVFNWDGSELLSSHGRSAFVAAF